MGLIVNEVSTNSLKHAFAGKPGEIQVKFTEVPQEYLLVIADNGRGLGEGKREGGLGLQLIDVLTQQADGRVEIDSGDSGTAFRFSFSR